MNNPMHGLLKVYQKVRLLAFRRFRVKDLRHSEDILFQRKYLCYLSYIERVDRRKGHMSWAGQKTPTLWLEWISETVFANHDLKFWHILQKNTKKKSFDESTFLIYIYFFSWASPILLRVELGLIVLRREVSDEKKSKIKNVLVSKKLVRYSPVCVHISDFYYQKPAWKLTFSFLASDYVLNKVLRGTIVNRTKFC